MNVLDGLNKQVNGRGLQAKLVLEGVVWFADLHKMLSGVEDEAKKFTAAAAAGVDDVQKYLGKLAESTKTLWAHLGTDANALALMADLSTKRKPDDLGVEGAPSYMSESEATAAKAVAEGLDKKIQDCGVRADAWQSSGIQGHLAEVLDAGHSVRVTVEIVAGDARLTDGALDDRFFEIHYAATGQVGNRHLADKNNAPGLTSAITAMLKQMKLEMMLIKAPQA